MTFGRVAGGTAVGHLRRSMDAPAQRPSRAVASPPPASRGRRLGLVVALALMAVLVAAGPAGAVPAGWTKLKRVFSAEGAPSHAMQVAGGKVHIAAQDGSNGIVYITDASGAWTRCRVSAGVDRQPSLAVAGGVVHVAFARADAGEEGIWTASSDSPSGGEGCGWSLVRRHAAKASHPSLAAYGDTLHVAFRTPDGKLRYRRGASGADAWELLETVDGSCCTSAPSLFLTHLGAPRVAYGDGSGKRPDGLRFALRSGSGWKKAKVSGGRVKHVSLVLDHSPGVFLGISDAPSLVYVIRGYGTVLAQKGSPSLKGGWATRYVGRFFALPDVATAGNKTVIVYGSRGKVGTTSVQGGIWVGKTVSSSGRDGKPRIDLIGLNSVVTLARARRGAGVYHTTGY